MANVLILGGGISGHTAALFAKKRLGRAHNVTVVTPNSKWNWIPSNIWVGVGLMKPKQVTFELAPVYKKKNIIYKQAKAVSIHPDGNNKHTSPFVTIEYTSKEKAGQIAEIEYDYLINASGTKLKFKATPGLGPDKNSLSVCTADHAVHASDVFFEKIDRNKKGEIQKFLIGTGNCMCTCQGAAFEYLFNVEYELNKHCVRDMADITYISNESMLGDFGVGGLHIRRGGYITHSKTFAESLFAERGIDWITSAHIFNVEKDKVEYELLDGTKHEHGFDFTMLIPPFSGVGLKAFGKSDEDITGELFAANGFMFVDADYTAKPFEEWKAGDWPRTYQNPKWKNIFAAGIAFAPPHAISKPMKSPNGTPISPTPPRTGMPSAMIGKATALSICDMILGKAQKPLYTASMTKIGAACIASAGNSLIGGSAVAMTMFPIVHDFEKYPEYGRDIRYSFGEIGLGSHWIKILLHHGFIYKAKANPLWYVIPE